MQEWLFEYCSTFGFDSIHCLSFICNNKHTLGVFRSVCYIDLQTFYTPAAMRRGFKSYPCPFVRPSVSCLVSVQYFKLPLCKSFEIHTPGQGSWLEYHFSLSGVVPPVSLAWIGCMFPMDTIFHFPPYGNKTLLAWHVKLQ